jgi:hypothetical protein
MMPWLPLIFVVALGGLAAYLLPTLKRKPRVLPPPSSKRAEPSYQETNSRAKLFLEVLALKEGAARWPAILQRLNRENEPHIRTLLLELRSHCTADPVAVLEAIESECISAKREGKSPSRAELLERALRVVREADPR